MGFFLCVHDFSVRDPGHGKARRRITMPRVVDAPTTVVKTKDVTINEYFGGASCDPCSGDSARSHTTVLPLFARPHAERSALKHRAVLPTC